MKEIANIQNIENNIYPIGVSTYNSVGSPRDPTPIVKVTKKIAAEDLQKRVIELQIALSEFINQKDDNNNNNNNNNNGTPEKKPREGKLIVKLNIEFINL